MSRDELIEEIGRLEQVLKHIAETSVTMYNVKTRAARVAERALKGDYLWEILKGD